MAYYELHGTYSGRCPSFKIKLCVTLGGPTCMRECAQLITFSFRIYNRNKQFWYL